MSDQTTEIAATRGQAEIVTANASRYLQQLCKHFAHKLPVTFDPQAGQISFASGECRLAAEDGVLKLSVSVPDSTQLVNLQDVVARHLVRFAFREELKIEWHPA